MRQKTLIKFSSQSLEQVKYKSFSSVTLNIHFYYDSNNYLVSRGASQIEQRQACIYIKDTNLVNLMLSPSSFTLTIPCYNTNSLRCCPSWFYCFLSLLDFKFDSVKLYISFCSCWWWLIFVRQKLKIYLRHFVNNPMSFFRVNFKQDWSKNKKLTAL